MEHKFTLYTVFTCILTPIIALLGGYDKWLHALVIFIICDVIAGILRVLINGEHFDGWKAFKGILKKLGYFVAVIVALQIDLCLAINSVRDTTLGLLCSVEILSISRNLEQGMGIPIYTYFTLFAKKLKEPVLKLLGVDTSNTKETKSL